MSQRGMLAQLAARLRARQGGTGTEDGEGEDEGGAIVVDDNCLVSANDFYYRFQGINLLLAHVTR